MAFLSARMENGIDMVLDLLKFKEKVADAKMVFTGEGSLDGQTLHGKAITGVIKASFRQKVPVVAITGAWESSEELYNQGLTAVFSICNQPMPLSTAMNNAEELISGCTEQICRLIRN